jgi:hypothetical protein
MKVIPVRHPREGERENATTDTAGNGLAFVHVNSIFWLENKELLYSELDCHQFMSVLSGCISFSALQQRCFITIPSGASAYPQFRLNNPQLAVSPLGKCHTMAER